MPGGIQNPEAGSLRYFRSVVAEIDLNATATSEELKALGQFLQLWHEQHSEISEIIGLNELSNGYFPPFLPGFPVSLGSHPVTGEPDLVGERPIVIRSDAVADEETGTARQALVQSLEACLPKAIVHRISSGRAFRMP